VPGAVKVTVKVPPPSGVPVPRQEFAVPSPGAEQTKKSWGIAPTLLTWNVTLPCLTVFVESVMANSVGFPSMTVTLDAGAAGGATAVGEKKALTCALTPAWTKQVRRVPRQAPVQFVKWKPSPGWARMTISPPAGRNVASQASLQASDPEPYTVTLPFPAIASVSGVGRVAADAPPASAQYPTMSAAVAKLRMVGCLPTGRPTSTRPRTRLLAEIEPARMEAWGRTLGAEGGGFAHVVGELLLELTGTCASLRNRSAKKGTGCRCSQLSPRASSGPGAARGARCESVRRGPSPMRRAEGNSAREWSSRRA
jgi:hypothetical protein